MITHYVKEHGLDSLLGEVQHGDQDGIFDSVDPNMKEPYKPDWADLVRLHKLIRERRVTTVLEFGCGYSTVVMADALHLNAIDYGKYVKHHLRRSNPFEIHSVDDVAEYVQLARRRVPPHLEGHVKLSVTEVNMTTLGGRICTEYQCLPNICPDFIYLDGPSQFSVKGAINGISTAHADRLPMSCDLLKIEHFLLPGTMILVDGRTANARFLKSNFQRNWAYRHDRAEDIHVFELIEEPLGCLNELQIKFSLGDDWPAP